MGRKQVADAWRIPDELWEQIEPLLPRVRRSKKGGRPPVPTWMNASPARRGCKLQKGAVFGMAGLLAGETRVYRPHSPVKARRERVNLAASFQAVFPWPRRPDTTAGGRISSAR